MNASRLLICCHYPNQKIPNDFICSNVVWQLMVISSMLNFWKSPGSVLSQSMETTRAYNLLSPSQGMCQIADGRDIEYKYIKLQKERLLSIFHSNCFSSPFLDFEFSTESFRPVLAGTFSNGRKVKIEWFVAPFSTTSAPDHFDLSLILLGWLNVVYYAKWVS